MGKSKIGKKKKEAQARREAAKEMAAAAAEEKRVALDAAKKLAKEKCLRNDAIALTPELKAIIDPVITENQRVFHRAPVNYGSHDHKPDREARSEYSKLLVKIEIESGNQAQREGLWPVRELKEYTDACNRSKFIMAREILHSNPRRSEHQRAFHAHQFREYASMPGLLSGIGTCVSMSEVFFDDFLKSAPSIGIACVSMTAKHDESMTYNQFILVNVTSAKLDAFMRHEYDKCTDMVVVDCWAQHIYFSAANFLERMTQIVEEQVDADKSSMLAEVNLKDPNFVFECHFQYGFKRPLKPSAVVAPLLETSRAGAGAGAGAGSAP